MTLTQFLDRLKELDEKATPRPWRENIWVGPLEHPDGFKASILAHGPIHIYKEEGNAAAILDSELITELRNALPAIRKVIRIQRDALEDAKDGLCLAMGDLGVCVENARVPSFLEVNDAKAYFDKVKDAIADCEQAIQEGMK